MTKSPAWASEDIERAAREVLGGDRVRWVECREMLNDDDAPILRVRIVYDAAHRLTVQEMERVLDALWPEDAGEDAPFPVIDFQEDTDIAPVAAE